MANCARSLAGCKQKHAFMVYIYLYISTIEKGYDLNNHEAPLLKLVKAFTHKYMDDKTPYRSIRQS